MINTRHLALLGLSILLVATPLQAQTDAADAATASASDGTADKPAAAQEPSTAREPAAKSGSAGASGNSPFDYRSSEEISEDVPVSFPVDM